MLHRINNILIYLLRNFIIKEILCIKLIWYWYLLLFFFFLYYIFKNIKKLRKIDTFFVLSFYSFFLNTIQSFQFFFLKRFFLILLILLSIEKLFKINIFCLIIYVILFLFSLKIQIKKLVIFG